MDQVLHFELLADKYIISHQNDPLQTGNSYDKLLTVIPGSAQSEHLTNIFK